MTLTQTAIAPPAVNGTVPADDLSPAPWLAAPEAERGVIAALLLSTEVQDEYLSALTPGCFSSGLHRVVYTAIRDLSRDGLPANIVTVREKIGAQLGDDDRRRIDDILMYDTLSDDELRSAIDVLIDRKAGGDMARAIERSAGLLAGGNARKALAGLSQDLEAIGADLDHSDDESSIPASLYERLIVPMPALPDLGMIDETADLIGRQAGAPRSYCVLASMILVAVATNHRAVLRLNFGPVRPNIYGAILGPSSVYHKTTVMGRSRNLLRKGELEAFVLSPNFTSEGLLTELAERPAGVIFRDEMGILLGSSGTKYLATVKQDLTALYDCQPYGRMLRSAKYKVDSPFLNILGATTPQGFFDNVSQGDWHDGFLLRWLIALPDAPPDLSGTGTVLDEADNRLSFDIAGRLEEIARRPSKDFAITQAAHDLWTVRRRERLTAAYGRGDDFSLSLTERMATYNLKIAMLLAIAGESWGQITEDHMQAAMLLTGHYETCLLTLKAAKADYGVSGGKMQKALRVIWNHGPAVTASIIMRYANMPKSELDPVLDQLLEIGAITETKSRTGRVRAFTAVTERLPIKAWR